MYSSFLTTAVTQQPAMRRGWAGTACLLGILQLAQGYGKPSHKHYPIIFTVLPIK